MNLFSKLSNLFSKKKEEEKTKAEASPVIEVKETNPEKVKREKPQAPEKFNNKFTGNQVMKILYWIAIFTPHKEIVEKIKDEFGISVTINTVKYYSYQNEDYKNTIEKIREKWGNDIQDLELAHKKRRIQEIEKIYHKCVETNQMKNALGAIHQIQGEVEKSQNIGSQTNYQINIYKDLTDKELEEERLKSIERIKMLKQIPEVKAEIEKDAV